MTGDDAQAPGGCVFSSSSGAFAHRELGLAEGIRRRVVGVHRCFGFAGGSGNESAIQIMVDAGVGIW